MEKININTLEGKILTDIIIHFVKPEINILYLLTSEETYCIQGEIGSVILGVFSTTLKEIKEMKTYQIRRW